MYDTHMLMRYVCDEMAHDVMDGDERDKREKETERDTQLLCSIYKAIRLPRKHWSCKSQWHQCTDTLRKHPSRSIYTATLNRQEPILWKSQW